MRKNLGGPRYLDRRSIISAANRALDTKPTTDLLLQNQVDIGNAVAGVYGQPAGTKLTELLRAGILSRRIW